MTNDTKLIQGLIDSVALLRREVATGFQNNDKRFDKLESRLDMIGSSVAFLEDDAPTREEHENLEKRVVKLEKKFASA